MGTTNIKKELHGTTYEFVVQHSETTCQVIDVRVGRHSIIQVMDPELLENARTEFYHKLVNHAA